MNLTQSIVRDAEREFRKGISAEMQLAIIEELIATRRGELVLAYPGLLDVSSGFKQRTGPGKQIRTYHYPCIIFHVRKKLKKNNTPQRKLLPAYLLAYSGSAKKRRLFAVRTDVRTERRGVEPQVYNRWQVAVEPPNSDFSEDGNICCALRIRRFPDRLYALSCRHVLSATTLTHPKRWPETSIRVINKNTGYPRCLRPTKYYGRLGPSPERSLDAEIAQVVDRSALQQVLAHVSFDPNHSFARRESEIRNAFNYSVFVSRGGVMRRINLRYFSTRFDYKLKYKTPTGKLKTQHTVAIESRVIRPASGGLLRTAGGDSGSPVVTKLRNGTLLGMHFAGQKNGPAAFMIPAYELLKYPDVYGLKVDDRLRIVNI